MLGILCDFCLIKKAWIDKKLTPKNAINWPHIEQRRVAFEMLGWDTIFNALDVTLIDKDPDRHIGELFRINDIDMDQMHLLRVRCGTGRGFVLPVPPNMQTALQANAWTWGFSIKLC